MEGYYGLLVRKVTVRPPTMPLGAARLNALELTVTIATYAPPGMDQGAITTHVGSCQ